MANSQISQRYSNILDEGQLFHFVRPLEHHLRCNIVRFYSVTFHDAHMQFGTPPHTRVMILYSAPPGTSDAVVDMSLHAHHLEDGDLDQRPSAKGAGEECALVFALWAVVCAS